MAKMEWTTDESFMQPNWAAEAIGPAQLIPGGARLDAAQFSYSDSFTLTLAAGVVTAGASKTLTLTAGLKKSIPAGHTLNFGSSEYFTLSTKAAEGATTIVGTLAADVEGGESAVFSGVSGKKLVKAGTLVGRTYTERDAGTAFGVAEATDDEIYLLAFDTVDAMVNPECDLLRHNTLVRDHLLPGWSDLSTDLKAELRSLYQCVRGQTTV
jgi:hypothetical protein